MSIPNRTFSNIQVRRGSASTWSANNPILLSGEIGFELDTGKIKIGNGTSDWNSLDYAIGSGDSSQYVSRTAGTVESAPTSLGVVRNTYVSTSLPSGGMDGDIWMVYT